MLKFIDDQLNRITMYWLTMHGLLFLLVVACLLSAFHFLSYNPIDIIVSCAFVTVACIGINKAFAYFYKAPSNNESVYITAFILALIISPAHSVSQYIFLFWASLFAMASKYILAINKKHLFNPAAFAVALTALLFNQYASWWVGTLYLAPFVFIVGFLITRKIKRWNLVLAFFVTAAVLIIGHAFFLGQDVGFITKALVIDSPILFFAFIMLTEPATTPPTKEKRIWYGILVGILYAPFVNIFGFYFSPELALVAGNIFSYLVSPKEKLLLMLKEKLPIATDTYDFVFQPNKKMKFQPGQYMEWTLAHEKQDARGIRRYFTIASSPTENDIRMGVKFYPKPSSYKMALESITDKETVVASQLAGDFTMPKDANKKLIFIAGGIGVTPFRSMIKYLTDKNEKRDIVVFYANNSYQDIAYKDIFDQAQQKLGIKTIYTLNNLEHIPPEFNCENGFVTQAMIEKIVPDFKERMFYISGPRTMIVSFEKTLKNMGIKKSNIKTDFFPGFA